MKNILFKNQLAKHLSVLCLMLLAGTTSSFGLSDYAEKESDSKFQKARSEMLISTKRLASKTKKADSVILYIGRDRTSFDKEHIAGSRFVGWNEITTTRDGIPNNLPTIENLQKVFTRSGIGNNGQIIIYGEVSGLFAARAFFTLDYLGHGNR